MIAARLRIGTIISISGTRGVVSAFLGNGRVRVCIREALYDVDAIECWSLPAQYNWSLL